MYADWLLDMLKNWLRHMALMIKSSNLEMHAADQRLNRKPNLQHKAIFGEKSSSLISTFKLV